MNRKRTLASAPSLIFVFGLAALCGLGRAQETPQEAARQVADHVLRKAEPDGRRNLEAWSHSVIERALERAGRKASGGSTSLPAEGYAGRLPASLSGRANGPEVIVFMSLSAPAESWRQWSREAARVGAPLVLRGLAPDGFRATVKRVGAYLDREGGAAIDPRLFRLFDITAVPAVAVVPGGVPPCQSRGCQSDKAPPHDRVAGNIGLGAALEAVAAEGGPGRAPASGKPERRLAMSRRDKRQFVILIPVVLACLAAGHASAEDPKAAARAVGQAGKAVASAIAKDPGSTAHVPGYAGTNLPERGMSAGELEAAANRVLADPADPGGRAGRHVIEASTARPAAEVEASDPIARRGDGIEGDAQSPRWKADGLASGSVTGCGAGVKDAGSGEPCGSVSWCVGADCGTTESRANTGFVESAARLNMVVELGGDEFDRGNLRFFNGQRRSCRIRWGGLADCCRNSGALLGLGNCTKEERLLARERHAGNTHYLGRRCTRRVLGVCVRRERSWCVFGSKLGRILQEAARSQLGLGWGSCRGFTVREMERIDFEAVDLTEFTEDLMDGSREPSIDLPEAGQASAVMRARIRDFYGKTK